VYFVENWAVFSTFVRDVLFIAQSFVKTGF